MYDFRAFCTNNMSDFVHRDAYRNCNMFLLLGCYSTIVIVYPFVSLIGLGLWSTWKESAVLIITDKVVCLMRHGKTITSFPLTELRSAGLYTLQWYDRPFQKLYFSTLPYDSDEERQAAEGGINSKLATEIHQTENRPGTHCITVDRSSYRIVMLQKNVSMFSKTNDVVFRITKAKS